MSAPLDIVISNARVVDPANGIDEVLDIGIRAGRIVELAPVGLAPRGDRSFDMTGMTALPGIIDAHVHLRPVEGVFCGFAMAAEGGVCTVLEMSGPCSPILKALPTAGAGLNVLLLEAGVFGPLWDTLSGLDPSRRELDDFVRRALRLGCFGVKLLGGHYPLTPEASSRFIAAAREVGAYVAWHAGSTEHGSNIEGMREACEIAGNDFVHLAHINSYCRGQINDMADEVREAVKLLTDHPAICSETYLSAMNGLALHLGPDGRAARRALGNALARMGFADSREGILEALRRQKVFAIGLVGKRAVRLAGRQALELWLRHEGKGVTGSFDANPGFSRLALCLAKRPDGSFAVDALATDGGRYPRNCIVSHGLALVKMQGWSLADFVLKTSYNPSRLLNLPAKGHLGEGADADVTVVDTELCAPVMTVVNGRVNLYRDRLFGGGGTLIVAPAGEKAIRGQGLPHRVADPAACPLPFRNHITATV